MVTKQQQLEWLAKNWCAWVHSLGYVFMSKRIVGDFVSMINDSHRISFDEWQQERNKMQQQTANPVQPAPDNSWHERGELPPVGCECEFAQKSGGAWVKAAILAVTNQNVIMLVNDEPLEVVSRASNVIFRPLSTERAKAIDELAASIGDEFKFEGYDLHTRITRSLSEFIYDAGYRKVKL